MKNFKQFLIEAEPDYDALFKIVLDVNFTRSSEELNHFKDNIGGLVYSFKNESSFKPYLRPIDFYLDRGSELEFDFEAIKPCTELISQSTFKWIEKQISELGYSIFSVNIFADLFKMPNNVWSPDGFKLFLNGNTKFESLCGIHKKIKITKDTFSFKTLSLFDINEFKEGGLGFLLIDDLEFLRCDTDDIPVWLSTLNGYLKSEDRDLLECKTELIKNGFGQHAKL